jgi:hypothetical protein
MMSRLILRKKPGNTSESFMDSNDSPKELPLSRFLLGIMIKWWRTIVKLEFRHGIFSNILGSILYNLTPKILEPKPKNQVKSTCSIFSAIPRIITYTRIYSAGGGIGNQ